MKPQYSGKRKITLLVHEAVLERLREAVDAGHAPSQSALVEEAVTEYLHGIDRDELRAAYAEAREDPLFLQDLNRAMSDFAEADSELQPG